MYELTWSLYICVVTAYTPGLSHSQTAYLTSDLTRRQPSRDQCHGVNLQQEECKAKDDVSGMFQHLFIFFLELTLICDAVEHILALIC